MGLCRIPLLNVNAVIACYPTIKGYDRVSISFLLHHKVVFLSAVRDIYMRSLLYTLTNTSLL